MVRHPSTEHPHNGNVAGGIDSSATSGANDQACFGSSGIVAGHGNYYDSNGDGNAASGQYDDLIGAGEMNDVGDVTDVMVGAGYEHRATSSTGFIGSGAGNYLGQSGEFAGGGGTVQLAKDGNGVSNSFVYTADSFVGAGDSNDSGLQEAVPSSFTGSGNGNSSEGGGSTVVGGWTNSSGAYASLLGGYASYDRGADAAIFGGDANDASDQFSAIAGGAANDATSVSSTVLGGEKNEAIKYLTLAAGYQAHAADNGSFVWSDDVAGSKAVTDSAVGQFVVRASGGTSFYSNEGMTSGVALMPGSGSWSNLSDRGAKRNFAFVDNFETLAKVEALPVTAWRYGSQAHVEHIGPMAQDFYEAFRLGADDRHITSIDEAGVTIAAIDALAAHARVRETQIVEQRAKISQLAAAMRVIERRIRGKQLRCLTCAAASHAP